MTTALQQRVHPLAQGSHLCAGQELAELLLQRGGESVGEHLEAHAVSLQERLPRPSPQDGAQLGLDTQADPVVAAAHHAPVPDDVAALAIGVVQDGVEDGDGAQPRIRAVRDHHWVAVRRLPLKHHDPPVGDRLRSSDVDEGVRGAIDRADPQLHRAEPQRPLPQHRRRNHAEPSGGADDEGRPLPRSEGAVGVVPQRSLGHLGLVDDEQWPAGAFQGAEQGAVGRARDPADRRELAEREQVGELSVGSRWHGGRCGRRGPGAGRRTGSWGAPR